MLILAACESYRYASSRNQPRLRALILLLLHSGLRISDAVTLHRDRISGDKLFLYTSKAAVPVYCPLPDFVVEALESVMLPGDRYFFWSGPSKAKTVISYWQDCLRTFFETAGVENGHAHRFQDTFAIELLLAGVPLERVSALLGHRSIKVTERHCAPWVRARQEQLEADVRRCWSRWLLQTKGYTRGTRETKRVN